MEKRDNGLSQVGGVFGLVGVRSSLYYYVGILDHDATDALRFTDPTTEFVVLRDAYELLLKHRSADQGMELTMTPVPIPPFAGPTTAKVRVDAQFDLSQVRDMVDLHAQMTGSSQSALVRPGSFYKGT